MMNKKNCILIGVILLAPLGLQAQTFHYGLSAGFDLARVQVSQPDEVLVPAKEFQALPSFNINGYLAYSLDEKFGISLEPGFIRKGGIVREDNNYGDYDTQYQLNYLQLPILADYQLTDHLFVSIGPEIAYLIHAKARANSISYNANLLYDRKLELSGIIGIHYALLKWMDIGIRYSHGLLPVSEISHFSDVDAFVGSTKEYNQYVQLMTRVKL